MTIKVDNLYRHADDGLYCLLSDDVPIKCPETGNWVDGVVYLAADGRMRATSVDRWNDRFTAVTEIAEDKLTEEQMAMVRRANPGSLDFDFVQSMESWHESEMSITGQMLELAVAVVVERFAKLYPALPEGTQNPDDMTFTITTEDTQRVLQTYDIERVPVPNGFTFRLTKAT